MEGENKMNKHLFRVRPQKFRIPIQKPTREEPQSSRHRARKRSKLPHISPPHIQPIAKARPLHPVALSTPNLTSAAGFVKVSMSELSGINRHFLYPTWNSRTTFCHLPFHPDRCCFQVAVQWFIIFTLLITGRYYLSLRISTVKILQITSSATKLVLIIVFVLIPHPWPSTALRESTLSLLRAFFFHNLPECFLFSFATTLQNCPRPFMFCPQLFSLLFSRAMISISNSRNTSQPSCQRHRNNHRDSSFQQVPYLIRGCWKCGPVTSRSSKRRVRTDSIECRASWQSSLRVKALLSLTHEDTFHHTEHLWDEQELQTKCILLLSLPLKKIIFCSFSYRSPPSSRCTSAEQMGHCLRGLKVNCLSRNYAVLI